MAEVAIPPAAQALRRELEFVKSLLKSGRNIDEMVAAANAAARVAARAADEAKHNLQKGGSELTVRGLPSGGDWDWRSFKRWLHSLGLQQRSIKFAEKDAALDVGVVRFATESDCNTAFDLLPTAQPPAEKCTIRVERGMAPEYASRSRKRGREGEGEAQQQQQQAAGRAPKAARAPNVCEAVCPWWQVPYSKQLKDKHQRIVEALAAITSEVDRRTYGPNKPEWVRAAVSRANASAAAASSSPSGPAAAALCCPLLGILRSPAIERYRNKSEFTAGLDEREKPSVGFLRGAFQDGITCVGTPEVTRHTSQTAITLAAAAASYIRDVSEFEVYDKRKQQGYWRLVLVREGNKKAFLPVPVAATAVAAAAAAGEAAPAPTLLDSPTFTSLDAFTYLVTFGEAQGGDAPATDVRMEEGTEAAAAVAAEQAAAAAAVEGGEEGAAAEGAAAAASGSSSGSRGMDVSEVCEVEPERPPPDAVLVMLQVNPNYPRAMADPAATTRELRAITAALQSAAAAAGLPLTTVRVQLHTGVSNAAPADAPLLALPPASEAAPEAAPEAAAAVDAASGPGYIYDSLCELRFRISPTAFFQVNSPATCALYKVVGDWAAAGAKTLLLDICCGTGTIGLTMASRVHKVIGVDSVASAIEDARVNAALNGITNAEFVAGKAEDALPGILSTHAGEGSPYGPGDVVAVADPPRAGLHRTVLRALLGCERIRRLVFVSCNPDNLMANVAALCSPADNRSGRDRGGGRGGRGGRGGGGGGPADMRGYSGGFTPFRPVKALAVDLFPHTAHVEAVMLLER
ncbi:hypothetical protein PLESTB_000777400 [Pleodorina starrii]|uniref:Uncharacterized protein n=1 Tax=Pleodorina starrii TaxID=330485 RepID=A0A9W6F288_9CHLO|nr:hypothetical protein PLESTM_000507200 [Pleodorina starrii]GLC53697.1 hypothetical protein PLESTB_000777400 [Pleodorina starrii]GLC72881.1 hypothetical protein PLESTF_001305400 [Pleodorina starrii]